MWIVVVCAIALVLLGAATLAYLALNERVLEPRRNRTDDNDDVPVLNAIFFWVISAAAIGGVACIALVVLLTRLAVDPN